MDRRRETRFNYDRDASGFAALVAAEAGWRALFATVDGTETGRSRIIAWASIERDGTSEIVGIIADPNEPKSLVAADGHR